MKTVLLLAGFVAAALAVAIPSDVHFETKTVDNEFVLRQKKVLSLLQHITQVNVEAEYYHIGSDYDIEANIEHYTNKKAVEEFLLYYRHGFLPHGHIFSAFNQKMREEAIALYHLFYYAKDFETFYKTAAWARVHLNEGLFTYSFEIAVLQRSDCKGIVLPAPYEIYPFFFVNSDAIYKMHGIKMQRYSLPAHVAAIANVEQQDTVFTINANYSGWQTYDNEEQRLSYFTEDIGLNTYYWYFHAAMPFWMTSDSYGEAIQEIRGEYYFFFHQQLLARYYMERLTNGLSEIPQFSWRWPVKTGYTPNLVSQRLIPFVTRNNYYHIESDQNVEQLEYLKSYEDQFLEYLEQGKFKGYGQDIDLWNSKSVNFVGNYWNTNADLFEKIGSRKYEQYYEIIARTLLGAAPQSNDKYSYSPVVLEQFQTALRDPVFYQLYKRVMFYFLQYKQYLEPYTRETLDFVGVKINDVKVDKMITYFDYFSFNATNAVVYSKEELKNIPYSFMVRQPRLNQKSFNVEIEIKSDVSSDAIVKIFLGPKYDSNGHPISMEDNWYNFVELDFFKQKLTTGKNNIVRNSEDFLYFKDDSVSTDKLYSYLDQGKVPVDQSENFFLLPRRLMLPKGTKGGYPFQIFVVVYPYVAPAVSYAPFEKFLIDGKPYGYPLDRPVNELYFLQPNMFLEDVHIYHEGSENIWTYNAPKYIHQNVVSKH